MKNMKNLKDFRNSKSGEKMIKEDVIVVGNDFEVSNPIIVPGTLISQYMKKVNDETKANGGTEKLEDRYGKTAIASKLLNYLATTYMNIENFPTSIFLGTANTEVQPVAQAQPQIQELQPQEELQDEDAQNIQAQATAQDVPAQEGGQVAQLPQGQVAQGQAIQGTQTQAI